MLCIPAAELVVLPAQLPELDRVFEAAKLCLAQVAEQEVLASCQLAHNVRSHDLPRLSVIADAGGQVDRRAVEVAFFGDRLTGI